MFDIIVQAAENFFTHQIGLPFEVKAGQSEMRTIIASIDIETAADTTHRIYIACNDAMIASITELFLGEEIDDEETLTDMALETTNLIVGSAKVLAEECDALAFTIQTPHFVKRDLFDIACDQTRTVHIDGKQMTLGIKEQ
jgi:hypothetical protein